MKNYCPSFLFCIFFLVIVAAGGNAQLSKPPVMPSQQEVNRPFGKADEALFFAPSKLYRPETWFHYIGGNVSKQGIEKDLEAITAAGFSGIYLFHGQFGGPWPGVQPQIASLSANWDDAVQYTAAECRRLGLNFSMNNCPGWATAGGPWITSANAMRNLIMKRTDITGGKLISQTLAVPQPSTEPWRDYKDITVLAFPTPADDDGTALTPQTVKSNVDSNWKAFIKGETAQPVRLSPGDVNKPYWIEVDFDKAVPLRSVEFSSVQAFNHGQSYEPGVKVLIQAVLENGKLQDILTVDMPAANFQDDQPITLACSEIANIKKYRVTIFNKYWMTLHSLRFLSAARKNSWESEAAWTLRGIERAGQHPVQSAKAFIDPASIIDITAYMDQQGKLNWMAPKGKWTILRLGHVNAGKQNGPAPAEATGWEANKLDAAGADAQFAGYLGRLSNGPLAGGLLNGMLIDSWECHTQSWTADMEKEFKSTTDYTLRKWLPALFGYVVKDHETSGRFLIDWRKTLNHLFTDNFYGRMSSLARKSGLSVTYETSAGDVLPGDILEYFKFADVPMCEFWQPMTDGFVGSLNFKPVKPTVSAARIYGKPRVAAEAFTSFDLSWDEHFEMLREVANYNTVEGVSHYIFHTYTHNPQMPFLPPGSSFGAQIGTPFLRGQTWWSYMPEFTDYLSRCTYMLERGKPVSDVLWYLGDEINHKPDQLAPFPAGYKYDYCNPDVLVNRLQVKNGMLVTPEGIQYKVLWIPDAPRMLPQTVEKINALIKQGAVVIAEAPVGLATLSGGDAAKKRFDAAVKNIWGTAQKGMRKNGKGVIISGISLGEALTTLQIEPDVTGGDALWVHRKAAGADWYFVTPPKGKNFSGKLSFRATGTAELWNPVTGTFSSIESQRMGNRTIVQLDLVKSNACFVVFRKEDGNKPGTNFIKNKTVATLPLSTPWVLHFPAGWGAPDSLTLSSLQPWKDLPVSAEAKAFSGTATYTTSFHVNNVSADKEYVLDLGKVDMAAKVTINGKQAGKLLAPPYQLSLQGMVKQGENMLSIEVTSTWFNRLVFDAGQPEEKRKTWTISGPSATSPLRNSGLMGPVSIMMKE